MAEALSHTSFRMARDRALKIFRSSRCLFSMTRVPLLKLSKNATERVLKDIRSRARSANSRCSAEQPTPPQSQGADSFANANKLFFSRFGITTSELAKLALENKVEAYERLVRWSRVPVSAVLVKHTLLAGPTHVPLSDLFRLPMATDTFLRQVAISVSLGQTTIVQNLLDAELVWSGMLLALLSRYKSRKLVRQNVDTIWVCPSADTVAILKSWSQQLLTHIPPENVPRYIQFSSGEDDLQQSIKLLSGTKPLVLVGTPHRLLDLALDNQLNCPKTFVMSHADKLLKYPDGRRNQRVRLHHYQRHPPPTILLVDLLLASQTVKPQFCMQGIGLSSATRKYLFVEKKWLHKVQLFSHPQA